MLDRPVSSPRRELAFAAPEGYTTDGDQLELFEWFYAAEPWSGLSPRGLTVVGISSKLSAIPLRGLRD